VGCSCTGSKMDWRETDEVSVLLPLSTGGALGGLGAGTFCGGGPELRGLEIPCINKFLNPSTSSDCLTKLDTGLSVVVRSKVAYVSKRSR